jgi:hypothetical protein
MLTFSGPDVAAIQPADSHYVVFSRAAGQNLHVIVIGDLVAGPLFTAKVGGSHELSAYSGSIQQVATRGDSVVASLTGYQVTIGARP